jgi:3',5'-cyclic-AMP phosphodiesterase
MRGIIIIFGAVLLLLFSSCVLASYGLHNFFGRDDTVRTRAENLTELAAPSTVGNSVSYTVAVITDVHFGADKERSVDAAFLSWLENLNSEGQIPKFVICLGDIAEHGYEGEMKDYDSFCDKIRGYGIQVYTVLGNHDLYNNGWKNWKQIVYPETSFYHFKTNNFSWYFLDTGSGTLGSHQFNTFVSAIQNDGAPKVVCMHYPVYAQGYFYYCLQDTTERNLLISYLESNNVKILFDGHTHMYNYTDFGFIEYNLPGFLEDGQWALVTIDETAGAVSPALVSK